MIPFRLSVLVFTLFMAAQSAFSEMPDYYDEPGLSPYRERDMGLSSDAIDPFSGQLTAQNIDLFIPGNGGLNIEVRRNYSVHSAVSITANSATPQVNNHNGQGWSIHFGRIYYDGTLFPNGCRSDQVSTQANPVFEMSDGSQRLLVNANAYTAGGETRQPSFITKDRWIGECISEPYTEDGQTYVDGGMVITSPEGTRYKFSRKGRISADIQAWVVTEIRDTYDNTLTIKYHPHSVSPYALIDAIEASDGRQVKFEYVDITSVTPRVTSISSRGMQVNYYYQKIPGYLSDIYQLTSVEKSHGYRWSYQYDSGLDTPHLISRIVNPFGGITDFTYSRIRFESDLLVPNIAVATRRISGQDVAPGVWTYDYDPGHAFDQTTVTGPSNKVVYKHFGSRGAQHGQVWRIGSLQQKEIYEIGSSIPLQVETYEWQPVTISEQNEYRRSKNVADASTSIPAFANKTVERKGDTFELIYSNFNGLGLPSESIERSDSSFGFLERRITHEYRYLLSSWIISQVGQFVDRGPFNGFDINDRGRPINKIEFGRVIEGYGYDSQGNVSSITYPDNYVERLEAYKRGIPQIEYRRNGTFLRTVNDTGTIADVTPPGVSKTSYSYDSLQRIINIIRPMGNPITVDWRLGGISSKTVTRGTMVDRRRFDGFGRETERSVSGEEPIRMLKDYDGDGRLIFQSYPNETKGTRFRYDALGRLESTLEPGDGFGKLTQYEYPSGVSTRIIDPNANATTYYYRAFSDPDAGELMRIVQPEGVTTEFERDIYGHVESITQGGLTRSYQYNSYYWLTQENDPEIGLTSYTYDVLGRLKTKSINNSVPWLFDYDQAGWLERITYPQIVYVNDERSEANSCQHPCVLKSEQTIDSFMYTATGLTRIARREVSGTKLTSRATGAPLRSNYLNDWKWQYNYDSGERLLSESFSVDSNTKAVIGYTYDANEVLKSIAYPSGMTVDYNPDAYARATQVGEFVTDLSYFSNGSLSSMRYGNGVATSFGLNERQLPSLIKVEGASSYVDLLYYYDKNENITAIDDNLNLMNSIDLQYDAINRLKVARGSWGVKNFDYDLVGNILLQTSSAGDLRYRYASDNRLESVVGATSRTFEYDSKGNVLSDGKRSMAYDEVGNLTAIVGAETYGYDANNRRYKVTNSDGEQTTNIYSKVGRLISQDNEADQIYSEFIYLGPQLVAKKDVGYGIKLDGLEPVEFIVVEDGKLTAPLTLAASALTKGGLAMNISWRSNLSGALGSGSSLDVNLVKGVHTITVTANLNNEQYTHTFKVAVTDTPLNLTSKLSVAGTVAEQTCTSESSLFPFMGGMQLQYDIIGFSSLDAAHKSTDVFIDNVYVATLNVNTCLSLNALPDWRTGEYLDFKNLLAPGAHEIKTVANIKGSVIVGGSTVSGVSRTFTAVKQVNVVSESATNDDLYLQPEMGLIDGGVGDDIIYSSGGATISGGAGVDKIFAKSNDIIQYNFGDGTDWLIGAETIRLGPGLTRNSISFSRARAFTLEMKLAGRNIWEYSTIDDLIIYFYLEKVTGISQGTIVVKNFFGTAIHQVKGPQDVDVGKHIIFDDGSEMDLQSVFNELLVGDEADNTIVGYFGSGHVLRGNGGNDRIHGGDKDDVIYGGDGDDQGNAEDNDTFNHDLDGAEAMLFIDTVSEMLFGHNGNDTIYGGAGDDLIVGGLGAVGSVEHWLQVEMHTGYYDGADSAEELAGPDNDTLYGEEGNDAIRGGAGADLIDGGLGDDAMSGGAGDDVYVYRLGDGADVIYQYYFHPKYQRNSIDVPSGVNRGDEEVYLESLNDDDVLELKGIAPQDVVLSAEGEDVTVTMPDGGSVILREFFDAKGALRAFALDRILFDSGEQWLREDIANRIWQESGYPTVVINAPVEGQIYWAVNGVVNFNGQAQDGEDGDLSTQIEWRTQERGDSPFAVGANVSVSLSVGEHRIYASVVDSDGYRFGRWVNIVVQELIGTAPELSIVSPIDHVTLTVGEALNLVANAQDAEDGDLSAQIQWRSSLAGDLGVGATLLVQLLEGDHNVIATVKDADGNEVAKAIQVTVAGPANLPPTLQITSPQDGIELIVGEALTLQANAQDPEQGDLSSVVSWVSSVDGDLGVGALRVVQLSLGTHSIVASVQDSQGLSATAQVNITVTVPPNTAPVLTLLSPGEASEWVEGTLVPLQASALDAQDGDIAVAVRWSSSLDGDLGQNGQKLLSVGQHQLTASVTDNGGLTSTGHVAVLVQPKPNLAPVLSLVSPKAGSQWLVGETISLSANAIDQEDGDISSAIRWSSSLAGELGIGATLLVQLDAGEHQLSLRVIDSAGAEADLSVNIIVQAEAPLPVANAGPDQTVSAQQLVTLDGSGSLGEVSALEHWRWRQLRGPVVDLNTKEGAQVSFTAPSRSSAQSLEFELLVQDALGRTATDTVIVSLQAVPYSGPNKWAVSLIERLLDRNPNMPAQQRRALERLLARLLAR